MTPTSDAALDALDDALRRSVAQHVDSLIARARHDADASVKRAQREAEALWRRAREEGVAAAAAVVARESGAARRASATIVLEAKQAALRELQEQVHEAVLGLREAPDYPRLLDGLTSRARARLGPEAHVVRDPSGLGGIITEVAGRRIDCTLPALADRALAELGEAVEDLWR